jgi:alpha,alpha-trehalose phosphorylase
MLHRECLTAPEYAYPVHEWRIIENRFYPRFLAQMETVFALANGYLGIRGAFEESAPVVQSGTFVNGFHETWPIVYGEEAYGFAKTGQTMLNVTDSKIIKLYVDDEPLFLPYANLLSYDRTLDMQSGVLEREILWETPAGKRVLITSRRLVSFEHRHLAAISYEVSLLDASAPVVISSEMIVPANAPVADADPRTGRGFTDQVLLPGQSYTDGQRVVLSHSTRNSGMSLACGVEHIFETESEHYRKSECSDDHAKMVFSVEARPGTPIRLVKYMTYHTSRTASPDELCARAERTLDRAVERGLDELLAAQRRLVDDFWQRSDVQIDGDLRVQQSVRWNLFQLLQASARAEGTGIGAKGLTGQTYEGHYFWDTEIYVLPFLTYTAPRIARNLLRFRHSMLPKARERAREVGHRGALFPWRTINGEEASAYYATGTAQYHINADIMHALRKYVEVTGDEWFLWDFGAEMLVETARLWVDLGFYSDRNGGRFCIQGVTGPDEYETVEDNNTYTNLMARENLRYAAATVERLRDERPERFAALVDRTGLQESEVLEWRKAADSMYLAFDEELGIHAQDDSFLNKEVWDLANTPAENYPLLLHYHPLVIYRHQVVKQADVVLAMLLLGDEFSSEEKRRNFDYYDPLTTGDSSLSVSIQSILASEIGYAEKAYEYFRYSVLMDLADVGGNVRDGAHIASIGGTWMAIVYGFAGMRDYDGGLSFDPKLPEGWSRLRFALNIRGQTLELDIAQESTTYLLRSGTELAIQYQGEQIRLLVGQPVSVEIRREIPVAAVSAADRITREKFDAVLFDLEGVITASAKIHAEAWKKMFDEFLWRRAEERGETFRPFEAGTDYLLFVDGRPRLDGVRDFLQSRGIQLPEGSPDDPPGGETVWGLGNRKSEMVREVIKTAGVDAYEGPLTLVKELRSQEIKTAVVTSSRNCDAFLEAAGISDLFDVKVDGAVAGEFVLARKPAPDMLLAAAKLLGVEPKRAAVVEGEVAGVQAGRAGGFGLVVGVARKGNPEELKTNGADIVVADLRELLRS